MKITEVDVIPMSYPTDDVPRTVRSFAVLRIETDDGTVGWGEASDSYGHRHPLTVKALIDESLRWLLLDQDPLDGPAIVWGMRHRHYASLGPREIFMEAISAIDIALWDIRGKVYGLSLSDLLGRHHDHVELYGTCKPALHGSAERSVEFLDPLLERGVKHVKIPVGRSYEWDEDVVRDVRRLLPNRVAMSVDGKYNYTAESALRFAQILAELGVSWFEEPIQFEDLDEVGALARQAPIALAYGEHAFAVNDFKQLIIDCGISIVEPDVTVCGGVTEYSKIQTLAEAHGARVVPHCGGLTAIGFAANLHMASIYPSASLFEYDARPIQPLRDELAVGAPFSTDNIEDGMLSIPTGPGLGVDINEDVFKRFPYEVDVELARSWPKHNTPHI